MAPDFARIVLITDPSFDEDAIVRVVEACLAALPPFALAVQLRDKARDASDASLRAFASRLRRVTRPGGDGARGARLLVNRHVALAGEVDADGVHLGGDAMPVAAARRILGDRAFVSVAAHDDDAVRAAVGEGADAALVSPIFASPGKAPARGVVALRSARALAPPRFALYALGGVTPENAAACIRAGAHGVAVIRALLVPPDRDRDHDASGAARAIYTSITS